MTGRRQLDQHQLDHQRRNREFWDADADDYQAAHADQLRRGRVWGVWSIPEAKLRVLGDVAGLDVLEYGCGAAHWSIALVPDGARVIALDQSRAQLAYARRNQRATRSRFPLVCASGESVPLRGSSFDLVFCDHGAMSFCDPERSVAEVARLLRPGGRLVFNKATLLHYLCWNDDEDRQSTTLHLPYFGSRMYDSGEGTVDFQLPYGEWIRVLRAHDMIVEDLVELRAPARASTTYDGFVDRAWARRWPAEEIWVARKT